VWSLWVLSANCQHHTLLAESTAIFGDKFMATTVSYVECARCKKKIPVIKSASTCPHCGALSPWVKTATPKIKTAGTARPAVAAPTIDWGFWSVAAFSFFVPPIGYFLYRSYAESGDPKATAAGMGALFGLLAHVARIAIKLAS
jgi:hypothetical protein